jgi:hypothetical protein
MVCAPCNNEWLSDLETRIHSLYGRLHGGGAVLVGHDEQHDLAVWLFKTALMVALTNGDEAGQIPTTHYAFFREFSALPPGSRVWVGTVASHDGRAGFWVQRFDWWDKQKALSEVRGGYAVILALPRFLAFITVLDTWDDDLQDVLSLASSGSPSVMRIWPASPNYSVQWPPPVPATLEQMESVMASLQRIGESEEPPGLGLSSAIAADHN